MKGSSQGAVFSKFMILALIAWMHWSPLFHCRCSRILQVWIILTLVSSLSYWLDDPGFDSWQGQEVLLYSEMSRLVLGLTMSPVQWVPEGVFFFFFFSLSGSNVAWVWGWPLNICLVPRLRMSGAVSPLPLHVEMACAGTALPLCVMEIIAECCSSTCATCWVVTK